MIVLFLRHADADPDRTPDFERRLTPKGLDQAEKVGKFCARYGLVPDVVITSPVVRAKQTAEIVAKKLGDVSVVVEKTLSCGMSPGHCLELLHGYQKFETIMVVGHEPDFSSAIASLIDMQDSDQVNIRKASLTGIDLVDGKSGTGVLQFLIPARLM